MIAYVTWSCGSNMANWVLFKKFAKIVNGPILACFWLPEKVTKNVQKRFPALSIKGNVNEIVAVFESLFAAKNRVVSPVVALLNWLVSPAVGGVFHIHLVSICCYKLSLNGGWLNAPLGWCAAKRAAFPGLGPKSCCPPGPASGLFQACLPAKDSAAGCRINQWF